MPSRRRRWEVLTDVDSATLGRPAIVDALPVPESVQVEGGDIVFDLSSDIYGRAVPRELLDGFVSARTDAALIRFAKRFGPLALFENVDAKFAKPQPGKLAGVYALHRESLWSWRSLQHQFALVLKLTAAFRSGEAPSIAALAECEAMGLFRSGTVDGLHHENPKSRVDLGLNAGLLYTRALAESCGLRPALAVYGKSHVQLVFQDAINVWPLMGGLGLSLGGALTVQLMAAIAGSGFVLCSSCGEPFVPKRRQPAFGRRRYCPECGRAAALRDAKATYRAKLRASAETRTRRAR